MSSNRPTDEDDRARTFAFLDTEHDRGDVLPRRGVPPVNTVQTRFGFSMILIGLIAMVGGAYPLPTDMGSRLMLLAFGLIYAFIGAWKIDRANRELNRSIHPPTT